MTLGGGSSLKPGHHAEARLEFENPDDDAIDIIIRRVYSGRGLR
jgi:hypothetical protein